MTLKESDILAALTGVRDPYTGQDFVSTRAIDNLKIDLAAGRVAFDVALPYPARSLWAQLREAFTQAAQQVAGVHEVSVQFCTRVQAHAVQRGVALLSGVRNIIAVASGKGGVGKSTTAANLALALAAEGARVGVLDADIYGPSLPAMFGVSAQPLSSDGKTMQPLMGHGVQVMSIGLLLDDPDSAMIWRGPMATQALDQMLRQTAWQDLDYLLIDMPPGTGDIHLSLSQRVPLTGAVIVSTPQDIALMDARKGIRMFEKVGVPVLGLVQNMAVHVCSHCGHAEHIFGEDGARALAQDWGMEFLGSLPLALHIRQEADSGVPTVVAAPQSEAAAIYRDVARRVAVRIAAQARDYSDRFPTITVSAST